MHDEYLLQALKLAEIRRGFCAPNPSVGAIVVKNNQIISTGYHIASGKNHAEVDALNKLTQAESQDATLYITLEPCCHYGKTPPCTQLIVDRGIKEVIYGYRDNNPIVSGKSDNILKDAGINSLYYPLPEITQFYASYEYWHRTHLPYVTAKIAQSLDGKIAGPNHERVNITGNVANINTHYWRKKCDALLTTAKTIYYDNPQLNARINNEIYEKPIYILDSHLNISPTATIFKTAAKICLLHRHDIPEEKIHYFSAHNITCIAVDHHDDGLDLKQVLEFIGKQGVHDLGIEAGGRCFSAFASQNLLQSAFIYIAAKILGENATSAFTHQENVFVNAHTIEWKTFGEDVACYLTWKR